MQQQVRAILKDIAKFNNATDSQVEIFKHCFGNIDLGKKGMTHEFPLLTLFDTAKERVGDNIFPHSGAL